MNRLSHLLRLNNMLLEDMPEYRQQAQAFPQEEDAQWQLFRSLVNVRQPGDMPEAFYTLQDLFLQSEIAAKGITRWRSLPARQSRISLWKGDITTLEADAIVNAANSGMTGCYCPCHGCIDNAIHTYAGIRLRSTCAEIMGNQGYPEPTGMAKITPAFNLPSEYVIHTVGPIVQGALTQQHREQLAGCYRSCMKIADEHGLESIAFCCISTGEFHFPNEEAAKIALREVQAYHRNGGVCHVIFNVFGEKDWCIYDRLLDEQTEGL